LRIASQLWPGWKMGLTHVFKDKTVTMLKVLKYLIYGVGDKLHGLGTCDVHFCFVVRKVDSNNPNKRASVKQSRTLRRRCE